MCLEVWRRAVKRHVVVSSALSASGLLHSHAKSVYSFLVGAAHCQVASVLPRAVLQQQPSLSQHVHAFSGWSVTASPADCSTWLGSRHIQGVESSVACSAIETLLALVTLLDAVSYLHVACMRLHVRAFYCGTLAVAAGPASSGSTVLSLLLVVAVSGAVASVACQVLNPSQAEPAGFPCVAGRSHCTTVCGVAAAMNPSSSGMAVPQHAVHVNC